MHPNEIRIHDKNLPELQKEATALGKAHFEALMEQCRRQNPDAPISQ